MRELAIGVPLWHGQYSDPGGFWKLRVGAATKRYARGMRWVDLRLGYRCNNQCRFCDQGSFRSERGDGDIQEGLLQELAGTAEGVWLSGGEVTLRQDLPTLIRSARQAGFRRVGIQTNGRILAAPLAAAGLKAAGLSDAAVALHGHTAEQHDFLVGAPGAFRQTLLGIRRLRDAGIAIQIHTVISRSLCSTLPELARLLGGLGVGSWRLMMVRPQGFARQNWKNLQPRYRLLEEPLRESVKILEGRVFVETVGIPLCFLQGNLSLAADRKEEAEPSRVSIVGEEVQPQRMQGPPCQDCRLADSCRGPYADYGANWGWDEFVPVQGDDPHPRGKKEEGSTVTPRAGRPPATAPRQVRHWPGGDPVPVGPSLPVGDPLFFAVGAPCTRGCPGCRTRQAAGNGWRTETTRRLRQRLVRAAGEGVRGLVFGGASPWEHPDLPELVREAVRLGFAVEVWGPVYPLSELSSDTARKLEGLRRIRVPALTDAVAGAGTEEATARALTTLRERLPRCNLEWDLPPGPPPGPLYRVDGWQGTWAGCQPG